MWTLKEIILSLKKFKLRAIDKRLYLKEYFSLKGHIYVNYVIPLGIKYDYNWGDDVNKYLIERISGKKVVLYRCAWIHHTNYICIGSTLQWLGNRDAVVWGAGLRESMPMKPCKKILAVRGPLTRSCLLNQGYDCPEIYGDPVLLFPRYYLPRVEKKYRIGFIPHFSELGSDALKYLESIEGAHLIHIQKYGSYERFIDEVMSCEYILSSSLHGCIVADAYEIPNIWCKFTDYVAEENGFKFRDYYLSVGKNFDHPYEFNGNETNEELIEYINTTWRKNNIDLDKLLSACPFNK